MNKSSLQFDKCYLDSIKIIMQHSIQNDLILNQGNFFKKIAQELQAEIKINQIDNSVQPEIPRITILSKEIFINFGLNRLEIGIKGFRKHVKIKELQKIYRQQIKDSEKLLQQYLSIAGVEQNFIGILAPTRFPQDINLSKELITKKLYELLTAKSYPELATFSFKIGFKRNETYENYEVSDYEIKNVNLQPSIMNQSTVKLDNFPTVETGVLINIDVNNKPQLNYNFSSDYPNLVNTFFEALNINKKLFRD